MRSENPDKDFGMKNVVPRRDKICGGWSYVSLQLQSNEDYGSSYRRGLLVHEVGGNMSVNQNFKGKKHETTITLQCKKRANFLGNWPFFGSGSPGRTRTSDRVVNSHLLYRLSYRGIIRYSLGDSFSAGWYR